MDGNIRRANYGGIVRVSICCLVLIGWSGVASAYTGESLAKDAQVSLSKARALALKAHPGTITDEELEKEQGGSGLRCSFDIRSGTQTYEVAVDARTSAILENSIEGANPD